MFLTYCSLQTDNYNVNNKITLLSAFNVINISVLLATLLYFYDQSLENLLFILPSIIFVFSFLIPSIIVLVSFFVDISIDYILPILLILLEITCLFILFNSENNIDKLLCLFIWRSWVLPPSPPNLFFITYILP